MAQTTAGGGTWEPVLNWDAFWDPNEQDFGVYQYTVAANDCPADTAYVTITPPSSLVPLIPYADTTVVICAFSTFTWNVDIPAVDSVRWDDGSSARIRSVSSPGNYAGILYGYGGCQLDTISLRVEAATPPRPSFTQFRACTGDVFLLPNGTTIDQDTTIIKRFDRAPACDSVHSEIYVFLPIPERQTAATICAGETYRWQGEDFTNIGNYERVVAGEPCDTLLRLTLTVSELDTVRVDTVLTQGQELNLFKEVFLEAGEYELLLPDVGPCGTIAYISVSVATSTRPTNASIGDYWYPSLLRMGKGVLDIYPTNSGITTSLKAIVVFDLRGRQVYRSPTGIPWSPDPGLSAGIYVFNASFTVNGRKINKTGRVVLTKG